MCPKFTFCYKILLVLNIILCIHSVIAFESEIEESRNGVCVLKGVCEETKLGGIPCIAVENDEPIIIKQIPQNIRSLSLLEAMCPHLHNTDEPKICCDELQLESMYIIIYKLAHLGFNRCPSCLRNLEKLFCELNCSPKQSQFIKLKKVRKDDLGNYLALELDYYISESFALGIFDSCKGVTNSKGKISDLMCGGLKGNDCKPNVWLNHMGKTLEEDGMSAFKINFILMNETSVKVGSHVYRPVNESYVKCSEPLSPKLKACDCRDCSQSCDNQNISKKFENLKEIKTIKENHLKREKRESGNCLMRGICDETAFGGIPCVTNEAPEPITDPMALEELREMCPHLVTSDAPTVCCTKDQVLRLNQTFEMISMFLKECPACVRNFEQIICHLNCATDQQNFMRITQTAKSESGKDIVSEVEYFINDDWVKGVFDSCKGVHRLGFNVLDHYCKPYKSQDCDHQKFMQFIGGDAEHFGHSPYEINFIFTNDDSITTNGVQYKPVKQNFYKCSDNPHTGEGVCPCVHCDLSCNSGESPNIQKGLPKYKPKSKREIATNEPSVETKLFEIESEYSQKQYCIFDTNCSDSSNGKIPCLKFRNPKIITDPEDVNILRHICPQLVTNDNPITCCDPSQIHHLSAALKLPAKLGLATCPSCLHNFIQILCQFTCSPRQNQFIRILNTTQLEAGNQLIDHIEYYVNSNFSQGLFDSCKAIHNGNVLNMMCGKWGLKRECTPQRWLDFMGLSTKNGGYSPFQMDVKLTTESQITVDGKTFYPMDEKAFACNELPTPGSIPCGCSDCEEACL